MAAELRRSLTENYHIDHVIELQLLVTPFLERGFNVNNDDDTKYMLGFIKMYQDIWNTEIKTKNENIEKARRVGGYLKWRYGQIPGGLANEIDNVIGDILKLYETQYDDKRTNREFVREELENVNGNYLEMEDEFYLLLTNRNMIGNNNFRNNNSLRRIEELVKTLSIKINMDHIVELQLLAYVLHQTNVANEMLRKQFVNYFHKKFNIRGVPRFINEDKGKTIHKWLMYLENGGEPINHIDERVVRYVANHYVTDENRNIVLEYIANDQELDQNERQQLHETEKFLFNLLNDFLATFERNRITNA